MSDDQDRKAAIRARFEKRLGKAKAGARPRPALLSGGPGKAGVDADDLYDAASLAAHGEAIAAFARLWVSDEHWAAADKVMSRPK